MKLNKTMLITALALGGLLTLSPALRADDATNIPPSAPPAGGPPPGDRGPGMRGRGPDFDTIAQRLNLTDDQKPKVKEILDGRQEQMRDLFQNNQDMSREDRMAKMKTIREDTDAKMKAVLTVDQFGQWQKMESRMRGPRNGPPPGEGGTNAPAGAPPQT